MSEKPTCRVKTSCWSGIWRVRILVATVARGANANTNPRRRSARDGAPFGAQPIESHEESD
jgi:hypothetical protein